MIGEQTSRRQFLEATVGSLFAAAALQGASPLEAEAQPSRKVIGAFSDNTRKFEILDRYSDGAFFVQNVQQTVDYSGEILYFVRKGQSGEYTEWSVRCDLFKKGDPVPVNTMRAEGSAESGKFVIKTDGPDKKNLYEGTLTEGVYIQSVMSGFTGMSTNDVAQYLKFFAYALDNAQMFESAKGPFKPMPPGYNPLQAK